MATNWVEVIIAEGEAVSERLMLSAHGRILGVIPVGNWDNARLGVDILVGVDWFPVIDAMTDNMRACIAGVMADQFYIICDFNHPLSDLNDECVRFVSFSSNLTEKTLVNQTAERKLLVCVRQYE